MRRVGCCGRGVDEKVDSKTEWTIEAAFPSYSRCVEELRIAVPWCDDYSRGICSKYNYLGYAAWYFKCLLSSVDPRGSAK